MSKVAAKQVIIIAWPNGAGKTTFAREFLPNEANCLQFVNADLIAAGLSPFKPESVAFQAGKLMLKAIDDHVQKSSHSYSRQHSPVKYTSEESQSGKKRVTI